MKLHIERTYHKPREKKKKKRKEEKENPERRILKCGLGKRLDFTKKKIFGASEKGQVIWKETEVVIRWLSSNAFFRKKME